MYVASEAWDGNIDDFISSSHDSQIYSRSISDGGKLKTKQKFKYYWFSSKYDISFNYSQSNITTKIFDGATLIHMHNLSISTTFSGYYEYVFKPYFINQLKNSSRLDIVFGRYTISKSLKHVPEKQEEVV